VSAASGWSGDYAELGVMTNFSFLEGASHPGEQMIQARALGLSAVGVADRNTLAGMVRALMGAEDNDIPLVVGCRLGFLDGSELIVFPRDRAAYGRLCRLLTLGKSEILDDPAAAAPGASNIVDFPAARLAPIWKLTPGSR
jgi:error-prone DNA polymerase